MSEPAIDVASVQRPLGVSYGTANRLVRRIEDIGILKQYTPGRRNRRFLYKDYLDILHEGTALETLPAM